MAKKNKQSPKLSTAQSRPPPARGRSRWIVVAGVLLVLSTIAAVVAKRKFSHSVAGGDAASKGGAASTAASVSTRGQVQPGTNRTPELPTMEMNTALMVTVELDFGPTMPGIADALKEVERRYQPDDRTGRTFAILDAYGGPTPKGKLHMSMHVSAEKPGIAALVFRRTGEVLWQTRIVATTNKPAFAGKDLTILIDDGTGKTFMVDGSRNPASILDAPLQGKGILVRDFWPDGAEREVTYLYSACGCPVKVMVQRVGDRTARTKELPVMFPDDPAVVEIISWLMRW